MPFSARKEITHFVDHMCEGRNFPQLSTKTQTNDTTLRWSKSYYLNMMCCPYCGEKLPEDLAELSSLGASPGEGKSN